MEPGVWICMGIKKSLCKWAYNLTERKGHSHWKDAHTPHPAKLT